MIEIYKCIHKLNPKFMWELLPSRDLSYQLRTGSTKLIIPPIKTKSYGINSFIFRGSILWNSIPNSIKNSSSLEIFKNAIKTWKAELFNCRLCCLMTSFYLVIYVFICLYVYFYLFDFNDSWFELVFIFIIFKLYTYCNQL